MAEFLYICNCNPERLQSHRQEKKTAQTATGRTPLSSAIALIALLLLAWGTYELVQLLGEVLAYFIPANHHLLAHPSAPSGRGPVTGGLFFVMSLCQVTLAIALLRQATWARKATVQYLTLVVAYKLGKLLFIWAGTHTAASPVILGMTDPVTLTVLGVLDTVKYLAMIYILLRVVSPPQT